MASRKASLSSSDHVIYTRGREPYTLRQYYEMFKHSFPTFIMVLQGYYGENEMEVLGSEQVLRIHSCVYQKRAVAVDSNNRTLSIPTNYALKFKVVNANNKVSKEEDTLCNILVKKATPVNVQLSDTKKISLSMNNSVHNVQTLGVMSISEVYEETYLLANAMTSDGKPNQPALLIPLYLKDILVTNVTGIEGKSELQWQAYQTETADACKSVKVPLDTGLKEIALYSPSSIKSSDNVYDYIEPTSYIVVDWDGKSESETDGTQTITKPSLRRPPPPPKPHKPTKPVPDTQAEEGPPRLPLRQFKPTALQETAKSDLPKHHYENAVERATVAPFTQIATDTAQKATGREVQVQGQVLIHRDEDKPIAKLSIEELGDKLKELKLDKYLKTFREQGVDGELALDLTESLLQEEFKFSKFESLKFTKFVRTGHIPK